jgi:hypothetical protein
MRTSHRFSYRPSWTEISLNLPGASGAYRLMSTGQVKSQARSVLQNRAGLGRVGTIQTAITQWSTMVEAPRSGEPRGSAATQQTESSTR